MALPLEPDGIPLAPLDEDDIADMTDEGSFSRGQGYYTRGNLFDLVRRGDVLEGWSEGSSGGPYHIRVTMARKGSSHDEPVVSYSCTCPRGGFCKHVVALLLSWVHDPGSFASRRTLAEALAGKSRDELAALIELVVARYPEAEALIDLPLPEADPSDAAAGATEAAVDPAAIRRQVHAAYQDGGDDWDAAAGIAADLETVREIGERYEQAGRFADAAVVYTTLAMEAMDFLLETNDEGDISAVIGESSEGLSRCLAAQAGLPEDRRMSPPTRAQMVRAMFDIWRRDTEMGGIEVDAGIEDALAQHASPEERVRLTEWIRLEIRAGDSFSQQWRNRAALEFLFDLRAETPDSERLEEYRAAGLHEEAITILMEMGRVEEALETAEAHLTEPGPFTRFANDLYALGEGWAGRAVTLVERRMAEARRERRPDIRNRFADYRSWLVKHYTEQGRLDEALALERERFEERPTLEAYQSVCAAANRLDPKEEAWKDIRASMLKIVERQEVYYLLAEIHLTEGDVGEALEILRRTDRKGNPVLVYDSLKARIAQAAEDEHPADAVALYWELAERRIGERNRTAYAEAAALLVRARKVCARAGRTDAFDARIAAMRAQHKALRALRDELDSAGLP